MAAQLAYSTNAVVSYEGVIYALTPNTTDSFSVETVAGIPFGRAVSRGTDPERQVIVGGSAFLGFTVRELTREGAVNTAATQYDESTTAAVMRIGFFWAICVAGCNAGDVVTFDAVTGALSTTVGTAVAGAKWQRLAAAGELSVVQMQTETA